MILQQATATTIFKYTQGSQYAKFLIIFIRAKNIGSLCRLPIQCIASIPSFGEIEIRCPHNRALHSFL